MICLRKPTAFLLPFLSYLPLQILTQEKKTVTTHSLISATAVSLPLMGFPTPSLPASIQLVGVGSEIPEYVRLLHYIYQSFDLNQTLSGVIAQRSTSDYLSDNHWLIGDISKNPQFRDMPRSRGLRSLQTGRDPTTSVHVHKNRALFSLQTGREHMPFLNGEVPKSSCSFQTCSGLNIYF
jgi:hypothetical protein